jgi:glycosyltransferase involved in cell wall biosynthesis
VDKCDIVIQVTALGQGGTERYAKDLAIGLAQRQIMPNIVYDHPPEDIKHEIESAGIRTYCMDAGNVRDEFDYASRLTALLRKLRPRLLHANTWQHLDSILYVARSANVPLVISRHGTDSLPRFRDLIGLNRRPFHLYRERAMMRGCEGGLICVSKIGLEQARRRYGTGIPMAMVYTAVPNAEIIAKVADKTDDLQVIWAGEMCKRKRPLLALSAFAQVQQRIPRIRLLMLGGGAELELVRNTAAAMLLRHITIPGYVPNPLRQLSQSHLFLTTACAEGLPYNIRDAMSVGLPVVATDAGGTREAVIHEKTGLLAPIDDERAIAGFLERLLQDSSLRQAYGNAGLALCRRRFAFDAMISGTLRAYYDLCGVDFAQSRRA